MKTRNKIMIDVETLGTDHNPVILSIGAVVFNLDIVLNYIPAKQDIFYEEIEIQSCLNIGLTVDASTINFWFDQIAIEDNRPQDRINLIHINVALNKLNCFIQSKYIANPEFWAWGMSDFVWLESAYKASTLQPPWFYNNRFDLRSVSKILDQHQLKNPKCSAKHQALDDCINQIRYFHSLL